MDSNMNKYEINERLNFWKISGQNITDTEVFGSVSAFAEKNLWIQIRTGILSYKNLSDPQHRQELKFYFLDLNLSFCIRCRIHNC
jgi:hypothetical protein